MTMKEYVTKAKNWLKEPENLGNVLRYTSLPLGFAAGANEWLKSQDAVASLNAVSPFAWQFAAGEALRLYQHVIKESANAYQAAGRTLSFVFPAMAALFFGDKLYEPLAEFVPFVGWGLSQGITGRGDKKREYELGSEIMKRWGREEVVKYIGTNVSDEELARYVGKMRRSKK